MGSQRGIHLGKSELQMWDDGRPGCSGACMIEEWAQEDTWLRRLLLHQLPGQLGGRHCQHQLGHAGFQHLHFHLQLVILRRCKLSSSEDQVLPLYEVQSGPQAVAETTPGRVQVVAGVGLRCDKRWCVAAWTKNPVTKKNHAAYTQVP